MFVYVNIPHEINEQQWYELADHDTIDGISPTDFCLYSNNLQKLNKDFYEVIIKYSKDNQICEKCYVIHKSCIQLVSAIC